MSTMTIIALVLAAALAGLVAVAAMKPDRFRIVRRIRIAAPAAAIYPHLASMRRFAEWSPWQAKDPGMTQRFEGPAEGVGSAQSWSGNSKVGTGRMEVVEAEPPHRLVYRLDFQRPMRASNVASFTLVEQGGETEVEWAMTGPSSLPNKIFDLLMNMDRLIGRDFEAGLANLKRLAEARPTTG